jgi:hypothetical protein
VGEPATGGTDVLSLEPASGAAFGFAGLLSAAFAAGVDGTARASLTPP